MQRGSERGEQVANRLQSGPVHVRTTVSRISASSRSPTKPCTTTNTVRDRHADQHGCPRRPERQTEGRQQARHLRDRSQQEQRVSYFPLGCRALASAPHHPPQHRDADDPSHHRHAQQHPRRSSRAHDHDLGCQLGRIDGAQLGDSPVHTAAATRRCAPLARCPTKLAPTRRSKAQFPAGRQPSRRTCPSVSHAKRRSPKPRGRAHARVPDSRTMSKQTNKLIALALVGACGFGVYKVGKVWLTDEEQSTKHAVNQLWGRPLPTEMIETSCCTSC